MHNVRAHQFLAVAEKMLDGELSYRYGDLKDAFESLRKAVRLEDELPYDEPWGWMSPTRHALGACFLRVDMFQKPKLSFVRISSDTQ